MPDELRFEGDDGFELDGTKFVYGYGRDSSADRFIIRKSRRLVECYVDLAERFRHSAIVELGIAAGGSTALMALLARPRKLVALEIDAKPVRGLAELIEMRGLTEVVRAYYGVNQADRERLAEIMDAEFPDAPLDLVIDDASHLLAESRSSFESLFPRLRPGGLFVVEDWNGKHLWAEAMGPLMADTSRPGHEQNLRQIAERISREGLPPKPLYRLNVELMLARATSGDVIEEITIGPFWTVIRRGPAELDPATFRVEEIYKDHFGIMAG
ncbi:MAG: class I SAM-dependent methyltransferase [Acidimicrobiales bacterium]